MKQLVINTRQATLRNNPMASSEAIVEQCACLVENNENLDGINVNMLGYASLKNKADAAQAMQNQRSREAPTAVLAIPSVLLELLVPRL